VQTSFVLRVLLRFSSFFLYGSSVAARTLTFALFGNVRLCAVFPTFNGAS